MKIKVIGWTDWEDNDYDDGVIDRAAYNAILQNMRENGYFFTGWHHQEDFTCAPVLNDGKIRRFTQRSWGGLIADLKGLKGRYSYAAYAFDFGESDGFVKPKFKEISESDVLSGAELSENYEIKVRSDVLRRIKTKEEMKLADLPEYNYMAEGDTVKLISKSETCRFIITSFSTEKKLPKRDIDKYLYMTYLMNNEKEEKAISEKYENAPTELILKLKAINE